MDVTKNDAAARAAKVKAADHAAKQVDDNKGDTEKQWPIIIEGFAILRQDALLIARTNDIGSGRYRAEFSRLRGLHKHLAAFSPSEASACCWAHEKPDLYEAAKAGLSSFYGQAPTPYTVYQRAMRIARAKDNVAKKNGREIREAAQAKAAEADQERDHALEERDRIMAAGHERNLLLERRLEVVESRNEKLEAELELLRRDKQELKEELELLRHENQELLTHAHGPTPASVLAGIREVMAANGSWSATAKALKYKSPGSIRHILDEGEKMSPAQTLALHQKLVAWRTSTAPR